MLYVTTRGTKDAYTAHRTLCSDLAPDGGCFIPMSLPALQKTEIMAMSNKSFGQIIAEVINLLFSTQLSSWDIDLMAGRNTIKLNQMTPKLTIAELWHNSSGRFTCLVDSLYKGLCKSNNAMPMPSNWGKIAIRIAVYFALYAQLISGKFITVNEAFDIALFTDDFSSVMSALYARDMGLPIRKVICTVEEGSAVWDFIQRGSYTPNDSDMHVLPGLERLIHFTLGTDEVDRFKQQYQNKRTYYVNDEMFPKINTTLFCAVAGPKRANSTINSVFRSNNYIIDPVTAHCYGGLQDYRSKSGENKFTLLLSESSPLQYIKEITEATGLPTSNLIARINRSE